MITPSNNQVLHPRLAVSTWSLHRTIDSGVSLLEIPVQVAAHGIGKLEICHFHFASTDSGYLADLRGALADAGVQFFTLLMDSGNITHPDPAQRAQELEEIERWINVAAECGAERVRVIAGQAAPTPEALRISAEGLLALAKRAADRGVRVVTENWHALLDRPAETLALLEMTRGQIGLMADFGNWRGARKYADLAQIFPYAESTHCKADYPAAGQLNREDFTRCLELCAAANFRGPHSLIFDGPGDEWASLDEMQKLVMPYLAPTQ